MKKVMLEINKVGVLKNEYNHNIKIGRGKLGYYIIMEDRKIGPFDELFIDKKMYINLIGHTKDSISTYFVKENGLMLEKKESLIEEKNIELDGCSLLGKINGYSIFICEDNGKILSVNYESINEQLKFDSYEDLVDYYNKLNISLNSKDIASMLLKRRKMFIKLEDLINFASNLNISNTIEDILFDIASNRSFYKKIYALNKQTLLKTSFCESIEKKLINEGYVEIKNASFENLEKCFNEEMKKYIEIINNNGALLKEDIIQHIKETDNIDFDKLASYIEDLSISDLSNKVQAEISAKRPLTTQIFSSILNVIIDKHSNIREQYKNIVNFKAIYPEEYETLWLKAKEKLPSLYKEYYDKLPSKINMLMSK